MQAGLLKVVPQAVLDLLTWQELEKKVCGDPEVTVDALRKLSEFGAGQRSVGVVLRDCVCQDARMNSGLVTIPISPV